jgi:hypothetical protein
MKLALSNIEIAIERRYKLDKPVVVNQGGRTFKATSVTFTERTYEYGRPDRTDVTVNGHELNKDGTPNKRGVTSLTLYTENAAPFIEALDFAVDERHPIVFDG